MASSSSDSLNISENWLLKLRIARSVPQWEQHALSMGFHKPCLYGCCLATLTPRRCP